MTPATASKRILDELIDRAKSRGEALSDINPESGMTRIEHFRLVSEDAQRVRQYIERHELGQRLNRRKVNPMSKAEQVRLYDRSTKKSERDP